MILDHGSPRGFFDAKIIDNHKLLHLNEEWDHCYNLRQFLSPDTNFRCAKTFGCSKIS